MAGGHPLAAGSSHLRVPTWMQFCSCFSSSGAERLEGAALAASQVSRPGAARVLAQAAFQARGQNRWEREEILL